MVGEVDGALTEVDEYGALRLGAETGEDEIHVRRDRTYIIGNDSDGRKYIVLENDIVLLIKLDGLKEIRRSYKMVLDEERGGAQRGER